MKPRNWRIVLAEAEALADVLCLGLAERGVPEYCWPDREWLTAEMLPAARGLFKADKLAAKSEVARVEMRESVAAMVARQVDLIAARHVTDREVA